MAQLSCASNFREGPSRKLRNGRATTLTLGTFHFDSNKKMEIAEIRKKLSRKLTFEDGISSLTILVNEKYPSLSPSERDEVLSQS